MVLDDLLSAVAIKRELWLCWSKLAMVTLTSG